ncbi:DUF4232 domain-containing protein [Kribbella sp. NPDC051620]|uniref:DUF4232 domain-containing protein n=1 Tax=Kribbella sp. NPDC051620 TaxID=3364120 RepID=UPI00379FD12F
MDRRMLLGLSALLLAVTGCGAESATGTRPDPQPYRTMRPSETPTLAPTPTPPPARCPANGARIAIGIVEATMGHRSIELKLTNCSAAPMTIDGYPHVDVLDPERNKMAVTVTPGSSFMAKDPGPARIRVAKGESVLAVVSWFNTADMISGDKVAGSFLSVARGTTERPVVWPVNTDIAVKARLSLTAWSLKLPQPA